MSSPIESALFRALTSITPAGRPIWAYEPGVYAFRPTQNDIAPSNPRHPSYEPDYDDDRTEVFGEDDAEGEPIELYRNVVIGTYRADIVLQLDTWRRLIVECDGHDWHDRTKQQAAYDRARDRELLVLKFVTIRFTGSEIHHSPERCARDAYACLFALHDVNTLTMRAWQDGSYYETGAR